MELVAILDADKEGLFRSETSLIQTMGRAARNEGGRVILYADEITRSIKNAMYETGRRREKQLEYNKQHGITPKTITKNIFDSIAVIKEAEKEYDVFDEEMSNENILKLIEKLKKEMRSSARKLEFEKAVEFRDKIEYLSKKL